MIKTKLAVTLLGSAVVLGVATGAVASAMTTDQVQADPRPRPAATAPTLPAASPPPVLMRAAPRVSATVAGATDKPTAQQSNAKKSAPDLLPVDQMTIRPGAVGPVRASMSKIDALATGYFRAMPRPKQGELCTPTYIPIGWKDPYGSYFRGEFATNGDLLSISVARPGPKTRDGFGVGTKWGDLKRTIDTQPSDEEFGVAPVFVYDAATDAWLTFIFDVDSDKLTDQTPVSRIELTQGRKPSFGSGGC